MLRLVAMASSSVVALAAVCVGGQALAQSADTAVVSAGQDTATVTEEQPGDIVVTGIRASLESAARRKRDSSAVTDSITAEDLGKFPDANVAESLQRIPGVSIDRSSGEGRFVTVRGLGPQFNTVLVNGRSLASDNYGREFSFDLLASELISGADVYKTSLARLQDGGIGSTINLRTARPFDGKGLRAVATAKANYEGNNQKVTPQGFVLLSDTFADDQFGLLASVSYQKRIATINSYTSDGYLPGVNVGPANAPFFQNVIAPRNAAINARRDERSRLGVTLVGQYRPSDTLLFTLDGLYNRFKSDAITRSLTLWFEPSQYAAAQVDANRSVTSLTTNGNADFLTSAGVRDTTTYQIGFNTEWNPTDRFRVVVDATTSDASNDGGGRGFIAVAGSPTPYSYVAGKPGELPTIAVLSPQSLTTPSLVRAHVGSRNGNNVAERVYEGRMDSEWKAEFGPVSVVRFGGSYTSRNRSNQAVETLNVGCFYCGYSTPTPPGLFSGITVGQIGSSGDLPNSFLQYDPAAYIAYLGSPDGLTARDRALGLAAGTSAASLTRQSLNNGYAAVANPPDRVRERVFAGYIDADFEADLFGVPWLVNVGGRYVHTELRAQSQQRQLLDLLPVPNDPTNYNAVYQNNGQFIPSDTSASYDAFLPNVNIKIDLPSNLIGRFGVSKTLTRPTLGDLRPVTTVTESRPSVLTASGGNPALLPYRANNVDLSLEWYPTRTTTVAVAGYYKQISDFIVTTIENEVVPIQNGGGLPVGGFITGPNQATFATARPRNGGSANIRGVELNVVHTFTWLPGILDGLGTQLNATFVDTNRTFANLSPATRFAVVGLSDSQNATIFYEKYGLSARVAYNHRNKFLSSIANGQGSEPLFIRGYGQVDASISYDVRPKMQLFLEGTNVFNAKYISTARYDDQLRSFVNNGARADVGVRMSF